MLGGFYEILDFTTAVSNFLIEPRGDKHKPKQKWIFFSSSRSFLLSLARIKWKHESLPYSVQIQRSFHSETICRLEFSIHGLNSGIWIIFRLVVEVRVMQRKAPFTGGGTSRCCNLKHCEQNVHSCEFYFEIKGKHSQWKIPTINWTVEWMALWCTSSIVMHQMLTSNKGNLFSSSSLMTWLWHGSAVFCSRTIGFQSWIESTTRAIEIKTIRMGAVWKDLYTIAENWNIT